MNMKKCLKSSLSVLVFCGMATVTLAEDVPNKKRSNAGLYLTATEAAEFVRDDKVLFVDVRTRAEVNFLGLPTQVDVHIPFMVMPAFPEFDEKKKSYRLEVNEDFRDDILQYVSSHGYTPDTPIVLMCRSGSRSAKAANILTEMGFSQVYSVIDGYEGDKAKDGTVAGQRVVNGWRNSGLEWSYSIKAEQVYPADTI